MKKKNCLLENANSKGNEPVTKPLDENFQKLKERLKDCPDIIWRKVLLKPETEAFFIYIEGIVDTDLLQRDFINPILTLDQQALSDEKMLQKLPVGKLNIVKDFNEIVGNIFAGEAVLICDGLDQALSCAIQKFDGRSIEEPSTEKNVRGAHEGFVELLGTNVAILRRRLKNQNLKFKSIRLGAVSNQTVMIAYIEGIANSTLVELLYQKLGKINFDGLVTIGHIEQLITDFPMSLFPQYQATERPDKVSASLMEGRLVVLLDGTPVALVAPVSFFSLFQAVDDYAVNWAFGTYSRLMRLLSFFIAVFLPAIYISVVSFHYYMVPLNLLVVLAESRAKVPFPPIIEALIMITVIDMLREAAIRLPTYIGTTVGVTGGIIIGQAAVQAGIVSSLLIIIVSVTAIATFLLPSQDMVQTVRLIRLGIMIASAIFGLTGVIVCFAWMFAHLVVLESLGQPYFQPLIPLKIKDIKDSFVRFPMNKLKVRPGQARPGDRKRGRNGG